MLILVPLWVIGFGLGAKTVLEGGGFAFVGLSLTDAESYPVLTGEFTGESNPIEAGLRPGDVLLRVGDADLRAQAAACPNADRIGFAGYVFGEPKHELLARASIGVVPSRADMIPGAMLELQSYGLPIVACDIGAIAEGADGGRAARLVPGDDAPAMAKALGELMDDPALRASLGAGSRRVSRGRVFSELAPRMEALYESLLRRNEA